MARFWEGFGKGVQRAWRALLANPQHDARMAQHREFMTHPELGAHRRAYIAFFHDKLRTAGHIDVDRQDERKFTQAHKGEHHGEESQVDAALDSLVHHGYIGKPAPNHYPLYSNHIQVLREAEFIRRHLPKSENRNRTG